MLFVRSLTLVCASLLALSGAVQAQQRPAAQRVLSPRDTARLTLSEGKQVMVDYEELPAVVTLEAAMAKGAPLLWEQAPGNIAAQTEFGKKDLCDAAFAKAAHVTKLSLYNQRLVPVSMEPRGSIAEFDAKSGRVTLRTSCQNPAGLQKTLAFNLSGPVLHSLWTNLSPHGRGRARRRAAPCHRSLLRLVASFRRQLSHATITVQGSGWGALAWEPGSRSRSVS